MTLKSSIINLFMRLVNLCHLLHTEVNRHVEIKVLRMALVVVVGDGMSGSTRVHQVETSDTKLNLVLTLYIFLEAQINSVKVTKIGSFKTLKYILENFQYWQALLKAKIV